MIGAVVICCNVGRSSSKAGSGERETEEALSIVVTWACSVLLAASSLLEVSPVFELPEQEARIRRARVIRGTATLEILGLILMFFTKLPDSKMALVMVLGPLGYRPFPKRRVRRLSSLP